MIRIHILLMTLITFTIPPAYGAYIGQGEVERIQKEKTQGEKPTQEQILRQQARRPDTRRGGARLSIQRQSSAPQDNVPPTPRRLEVRVTLAEEVKHAVENKGTGHPYYVPDISSSQESEAIATPLQGDSRKHNPSQASQQEAMPPQPMLGTVWLERSSSIKTKTPRSQELGQSIESLEPPEPHTSEKLKSLKNFAANAIARYQTKYEQEIDAQKGKFADYITKLSNIPEAIKKRAESLGKNVENYLPEFFMDMINAYTNSLKKKVSKLRSNLMNNSEYNHESNISLRIQQLDIWNDIKAINPQDAWNDVLKRARERIEQLNKEKEAQQKREEQERMIQRAAQAADTLLKEKAATKNDCCVVQ